LAAEPPLICGACASRHAGSERFCPTCGIPLVFVDGPARLTDRRERARKVRPQYSEGRLVRVASAPHQAEAEMVSQMLLDEGVASVVRRSGGFDVPDFLAAGPRDIMVAESGVEIARDVLGVEPPANSVAANSPRSGRPLWVQAFAVTMIAVVFAAMAAGVMLAVIG
jgi:hypothetical protein